MSDKKIAITLYEDEELMKQAKDEIKNSFFFSKFAFVAFLIFSICVDYKCLFPILDRLVQQSENLGKIVCAGIVFLIDIIVPVFFGSQFQKMNISPKKLKKGMMYGVSFSMGFLMILIFVQKVLAADVQSMREIPLSLKRLTQVILATETIATSATLLCLDIIRSQIKIYRKYRYLELREARLVAKVLEGREVCAVDMANVMPRDDCRFLATVLDVFTKCDSLFTKARERLAINIGLPEASEKILGSERVYIAPPLFIYLRELTLKNPVLPVLPCDDDDENKEV